MPGLSHHHLNFPRSICRLQEALLPSQRFSFRSGNAGSFYFLPGFDSVEALSSRRDNLLRILAETLLELHWVNGELDAAQRNR